jgi:hypothetical protein
LAGASPFYRPDKTQVSKDRAAKAPKTPIPEPIAQLQSVFAALPESVKRRYGRADSGFYCKEPDKQETARSVDESWAKILLLACCYQDAGGKTPGTHDYFFLPPFFAEAFFAEAFLAGALLAGALLAGGFFADAFLALS